MKKVKIMLTAIAVFAVVGGALAFKAKAFGTQIVWCANAAGQLCDDFSFTRSTLTDSESAPVKNVYCTIPASSNQACEQTSVTTTLID